MSDALRGRHILVTGAGQGIGAAIARAAARAGAKVAVNDVDADRAHTTAEELANEGSAYAVPGDVATRHGAREVVDAAVATLGGLDGLVNNAGIVRFGTMRTTTDADWDETMAVDFSGVAYVSKAAFDALRGNGSIVNVSSIAAFFPSVTVGSYSAAKAAVSALTKHLAVEWGPEGIRCNAVAPGLISGTSMTEVADADPRIAARRNEIVPLRRTGRPEDIADVVAFLLSDAARYVTGQVILVDGGLSVGLLEFIPRPGEQDIHRGGPAALDRV